MRAPMGSNDVQTIPIGINVRSAVRCAKAAHQPWKAHATSLPDPKSIVGLNRENTTLEMAYPKRSHKRISVWQWPFPPEAGRLPLPVPLPVCSPLL